MKISPNIITATRPFVILILCTFAVQVFTQAPSWSRGIQSLTLSLEDCKTRGRNGLAAEGYTIQNQGGDNSGGDYYYGAFKDSYSAVLAFNSSNDGKTWVNIFVSTNLYSPNGDLPGVERIKLQQWMDSGGSGTVIVTGTVPGTATVIFANLGGEWQINQGGSWKLTKIRQEGNQVWFTNEYGSSSSGTIESSTRVRANDWKLGATLSDANTINWDNGTTWLRKLE
jgi:hypothetical protein